MNNKHYANNIIIFEWRSRYKTSNSNFSFIALEYIFNKIDHVRYAIIKKTYSNSGNYW